MKNFHIILFFAVFSFTRMAKSEEQPDIATEMAALANEAVKDAKANYTIELDFSMKSLEAVEEVLTKKVNPLPLDELVPKEIEESLRYGAYIGETLRREHKDLQWLQTHPEYPGGPPVLVRGDIYIFPVSWALKRIHYGREADKVAPKIKAFIAALDVQAKQKKQDGAEQPATALEAKPKDGKKPKGELEERSQ